MNISENFRSVVVVNSQHAVTELGMKMRDAGDNLPNAVKAIGRDKEAGAFFLFAGESRGEKLILEVVLSPDGKDTVSTVYQPHGIFNSPGTLIEARKQLIDEVSKRIGLPAESIGIDDRARGRSVSLNELPTGQLIDLLAEQQCCAVAVASDTVAGGAIKG